MKTRVLIASLLMLASVVAQDVGKEEQPGKTLRWVGCGIAKKSFMAALADDYRKHTGVEIVLEGGGATRGIRDVVVRRDPTAGGPVE